MTGRASIEVHKVGSEELPVLVIDNALSGAERLIDRAADAVWDVKSPYYPGIRARAPRDYADALARVLTAPVFEAFGWTTGGLMATETSFSLVTTPPEQLIPFQRVPHFDGTDIHTLAVLHYLSDDPETGTSFFRHRATGYESVDETRYSAYREMTDREVNESPPPEGYLKSSNDRYERTAQFSCAYNRILIYQGHTLHCGHIPEDFAFSEDPRQGRLTVNTFLQYRP